MRPWDRGVEQHLHRCLEHDGQRRHVGYEQRHRPGELWFRYDALRRRLRRHW